MSQGSDHSVRIGDLICFFDEKIQGFVYSDDTSVKNNGLKVFCGQAINSDVHQVPNVHALTFQILTANRYKLTKDYNRLKQDDKVSDRIKASAKYAAEDEFQDNKSEQERLLGHPVKYGDIIQLRHVLTNKFVAISTKESSRLDKHKMKVSLQENNALQAQFRVQPRYKVKTEGELLEIEDMIVLESVKSPDHFLHIDTDKSVTEINCATDPSVYQVYKHYTPNAKLEDVLRGGSAIQLFHKDIEGYISAEGGFGKEVIENAHLRLRPIDPTNIKSYKSPKNTNTLWQVVLEESTISGDTVKWESTFHLLHMTTKHYLSFSDTGEALLVMERGDSTLFQFQPLLHETEKTYVQFEHTIRLYHLKTKGWMHSGEDMPYQRRMTGEEGSLEAIEWDKAKLLKLKVSSKRQYPDVFITKTVDDDTLSNFYHVGGLFPFVGEIISKASSGDNERYQGKEVLSINKTFDELVEFVSTGSRDTATSRQNMLRHTKLTDCLVEILKIPFGSKRKLMMDVFRKIYEVFFYMTSSRTTANLLYCGRYLHFFQSHMLLPKSVGEQCTRTVIELIKNNRKVLDRIRPSQIIAMTELLIKHKQPQYFDLLGALCICNDVAITENQTIVAENILLKNKNHVYQLETHKDKKTGKYKMFISGDDGHSWESLHKFCDEHNETFSRENHTFFKKQLDLYKNLCFGGNLRCLDLVIKNERIFTWEVVLVAMRDQTLPDDIKTKICSVLIETYLASASTTSILDNISNNFVYRNVGQRIEFSKGAKSIDDDFPGLKTWLMAVLKENTTLQESTPDRNEFLLQVIRLVTGLVQYGFIHGEEDLEYFKSSFMHYIKGNSMNDETQNKRNEEKSILDTKVECTRFIDILFALQTTRRIQELIVVFKTTLQEADKPSLWCGLGQNDNSTLLSQKLTAGKLWDSKCLQMKISKLIDELCQKCDVCTPDIVNVFFRMTEMGSDTLRRKAFHLLNLYYSSIPTFITTAERAMLLLSRDSEKLHAECLSSMPILRKFSNSKITEEDVSSVCDILQTFSGFCNSEHLSKEERNMRQNILVNNGILEVLRKLIAQDTDKQLTSLQMITETVIKKSMELLQDLAHQNSFVKGWVYEYLFDILYDINVCGAEISMLLNEVFIGEPELCAKVGVKNIKKLVKLCARYQDKAPGWLLVIKLLIKDPSTGAVNARNQLETMKCLMTFFSSACFPMTKSEAERVAMLLGYRGQNVQTYYVSLVDLIATCSQGKNIYIESTCQKFLSVGETLKTITDSEVPISSRQPFAVLFINVFLNSTKSPLEIGMEDLDHDPKMWELIHMIIVMASNTGTNDEVVFLIEVGFAIIKCFLTKFYKTDESEEYPDEQTKLAQLENTLEKFCYAVIDYVTKPEQFRLMSETLMCLRSVTGSLSKVEIVQDKTSIDKTLQKAHDLLQSKHAVKKKKKASFSEEISVNTKFQTLCSNLHQFVIGKNTVGYQCSRPEKYLATKEYFPSDVPLPKGVHFQHFVSLINGQPAAPDVKYEKAKQVIEQLRVSYKLWPKSAPKEQEELDLRCLQILRALIYNKIMCLPKSWNDLFAVSSKSKKTTRLLLSIKRIQDAMDSFGVIDKVMPLIARTNPEFGRQIFQLLDMLLFNVNRKMQTSVYKYFCDTREEAFFIYIKGALDKAVPGIKERRAIEIEAHTAKSLSRIKQKKGPKVEDPPNFWMDQHHIDDLEMILRVLPGLCDGQNKSMQDHFRVQPDNLKSVNIVARLTEYLSLLCSGITQNNIELCTNLIDTLHEICEGNPENTETMLNNKIVDYVNHLLRKTDFMGCTLGQVVAFRMKVGVLLYSMIEEHNQSEPAKSVCKTVSVEHIKYVMTVCFNVCEVGFNGKFNGKMFMEGLEALPRLSEEKVNMIESVGFLYYIILETMCDIDHKLKKTILNFNGNEKAAYEYFKKACRSVEILKEDKIQKKHFRVQNEKLLREETKEVVKWGVDRSSPSSKLRDLLFYSQDILKDIDYQKQMHKHKVLTVTAQNWILWNYACILLSLVINILMLTTWAAPATLADLQLPTNPQSLLDGGPTCLNCQKPSIMDLKENMYYIALYILGSIHILCSSTLFACYMILYHPTLPTVQFVKELFSVNSGPKRKSKLEIHFISGTTLYYMLMVLFSVLGTVYYGYFFACHLFGIIENNQLLKGVVKAVTLNGRSLIWVGILGLLVLYIYTLIAFSSLRASMNIDEEVFCRTLAECFVSMIRYGTIGDYGDKWHLHQHNIDMKTFGYLSLFNVSFFIIFTTILLNIIFGIIVDTFSEIRDTKWIAEKDMQDCCFICSRNSHDFEHYSKGFDHHVHKEHNMWAYVFYFIYIFEKEPKDYTALDLYVATMFKDVDDGMFPMNRALSLTKPPEYTVEDQVDDVMKTIVDMKKIQNTQGKTLVQMKENIEEIDQHLQNQKDETDKVETEMEQSRHLALLADKWRKDARLAEITRRMSIFTKGTSSDREGDNNVVTIEEGTTQGASNNVPTLDEESLAYVSEDEVIQGEEEENVGEDENEQDNDDDISQANTWM